MRSFENIARKVSFNPLNEDHAAREVLGTNRSDRRQLDASQCDDLRVRLPHRVLADGPPVRRDELAPSPAPAPPAAPAPRAAAPR